MQEGVHLAVFRRPFLLQGAFAVAEQGMVLRVARGKIGGSDFGADQRQAFLVFLPGIAEKAADLLTGGIKQHGYLQIVG